MEPAASTSRAAQLAATEAGVAAIGSKLAGELYGLHVLFENIEDSPTTSRDFSSSVARPLGATGEDKTAIMFRTAHTPGRAGRACSMCSRKTESTFQT
jgi:chorismate mutase/prephenate dehydratase